MQLLLSDKASLIIRAMLGQPDRQWVVRDFEKEYDVGRARAADILSELRGKGFIRGISSGRSAHNILQHREALLDEWLKSYAFELNKMHLYYSADADVLSRLKKYFLRINQPKGYALTLHTGANFVTNYVNTPTIYCYLPNEDFKKVSLELRQALELKELKNGGNVYLIEPYYKSSVFFDSQTIKGYSIVSDLQLYLDLYNFPQRGREHALYLLKTLKEEGKNIV